MNFLRLIIVAALWLAVSLDSTSQTSYPYNPDGNEDGQIAIADLMELLTLFGQPFSAAPIEIGDSTLTSWITIMSQAIIQQQHMIDTLTQMTLDFQSCTGLAPTYAISIQDETTGYGCGGNINVGTYIIPEGETWNVLLLNMSSGCGGWTVNGTQVLPASTSQTDLWLQAGDILACTPNMNGNCYPCASQSWSMYWSVSGVAYSN